MLCRLNKRDGGRNVHVSVSGHGDGLRHNIVKVLIRKLCGLSPRARVNAMEGHNIETTGGLTGESLSERGEDIKAGFLGSIHKFVRYSHAVFDLKRANLHRGDSSAAVALSAVFANKVNFLVKREGENIVAVE